MTPEQFTAWLKQWLVRHPVKSPPEDGPAYTREVMRRVESLASPSPARPWELSMPWVWALGGAVATLLLVFVAGRPSMQVAREEQPPEVAELLAVLSEAGEEPSDIVADVDPEEAARELVEIDQMRLAEAPAAEDALESMWQELEILNQLEGASEAGSDVEFDSPEELLEDVEWMDQATS